MNNNSTAQIISDAYSDFRADIPLKIFADGILCNGGESAHVSTASKICRGDMRGPIEHFVHFIGFMAENGSVRKALDWTRRLIIEPLIRIAINHGDIEAVKEFAFGVADAGGFMLIQKRIASLPSLCELSLNNAMALKEALDAVQPDSPGGADVTRNEASNLLRPWDDCLFGMTSMRDAIKEIAQPKHEVVDLTAWRKAR